MKETEIETGRLGKSKKGVILVQTSLEDVREMEDDSHLVPGPGCTCVLRRKEGPSDNLVTLSLAAMYKIDPFIHQWKGKDCFVP